MSIQHFRARITVTDSLASIAIPFDPAEVWGARERYVVKGSIDERWFRGYLEEDAGHYVLNLGARWMCRNTDLEDGAEVKVTIQPEGDEIAGLSSDIRAAIEAESEALSFFETVAPFYRRNYIRWIESAKRPETRQARIAEAVRKLKAGKSGSKGT